MENLRATAERDLADTLEGEFAMPVELMSPDGIIQITKKNTSQLLAGQVLYFSTQNDPATGEQIVVNMPVVTLRISSLERVPADGERWFIRMPTSPRAGAPKIEFVVMSDRSAESGTDIGFIKLYPQKVEHDDNGGGYES